MKRKLISLLLTLTTVFACFSMAMIPGAAEDTATATPEVWFGGHQRTVVADTSYGIRLIGLANDLHADEVGFDVAVIKNDGSMATFEQPITTVYTSITANVEGTENEIKAESFGAKYIFTVVIDEIDPSQGFWGYLCSTYYKVGGEKVSCETNKIVYNGANLYKKQFYTVSRSDVAATWKTTTQEVNKTYSYGSAPVNPEAIGGEGTTKQKPEAFDWLWDGNADTKYLNFYPNGVGSWASAEFENSTIIKKIVLTTIWDPTRNIGVEIQASVTGEDDDWNTLYTISANDGSFVEVEEAGKTTEWKRENLEITVEDTTAYNFIRVYDSGTDKTYGFCLSEVAVYGDVTLAPVEYVDALYDPDNGVGSWSAGTASEEQYGFYGSARDGASHELESLWDNIIDDKRTHFMTWGSYGTDDAGNALYNTGAYCAAEFEVPTVIQKIEVTCPDRHSKNKNVQIQASENGIDWVTLYTISDADGDFVVTSDWEYKTLTIDVIDSTKYSHIRVYENGTDGFLLNEIKVYTPVCYDDNFATKLNTQLGNVA